MSPVSLPNIRFPENHLIRVCVLCVCVCVCSRTRAREKNELWPQYPKLHRHFHRCFTGKPFRPDFFPGNHRWTPMNSRLKSIGVEVGNFCSKVHRCFTGSSPGNTFQTEVIQRVHPGAPVENLVRSTWENYDRWIHCYTRQIHGVKLNWGIEVIFF